MSRRSTKKIERVPAGPIRQLVEGRSATELARRLAERHDGGSERGEWKWKRYIQRLCSGSVRTLRLELADKICVGLGEWPGALFPELWDVPLEDIELVDA